MKHQLQRRGKALLPAILVCSLAGTSAQAQLTESYTHFFNDYDTKNYSTTLLPGTGLSLMAGTMFGPYTTPYTGDQKSIHMLLTQYGTGSSPATTLLSKQFNDPDYDERAVGAHFIQGAPDNIVIVAARIDTTLIDTLDGIELLRVDGLGNLTSALKIMSVDNNLYPLGSLEDNGVLYICGYATKKTTSNYPQRPEFQTRKQILVIKYNIGSNLVLASRLFDYTPPGPLTVHDYDMATRMKMLSNGNLFVTGSCNTQTPGSTDNFSGTLSLVLDNALNIVADQPFSSFTPPYMTTPRLEDVAESGFDIIEDPGTGGYFIFGNRLLASSSYRPQPMFFHITYVDAAMNPYPRNRYMFHDFDYAWGVNTVEGDNPKQAILSGYQSNLFYPTPNNQLPISNNNVNPFLAKYDLSYDFFLGSISAIPVYWSTILSDAGTGMPGVDPNNFWDQGDYFSNVAWGPVTTARDLQFSGNVFLSGPIWGAGNDKLHMKMINTDRDGRIQACPFEDNNRPKEHIYDATASSLYATVFQSNFATIAPYYTEHENNVRPDRILDCTNDWVFKPTAVNDPVTDAGMAVMPNPAHDYIIVDPGTASAAESIVTVTLTDMTGRKIADLYKGKRSGLQQHKLNLPEIAAGLYLINLDNSGGLMKTQKLAVQ